MIDVENHCRFLLPDVNLQQLDVTRHNHLHRVHRAGTPGCTRDHAEAECPALAHDLLLKMQMMKILFVCHNSGVI